MVRKALIPIAGLAIRMGPLAQAIPKAMWPVIDGSGKPRPVLHLIIKEALSAGIEEIGLILSPNHTEIVRQYFAAARKTGDTDIPQHIEYIVQAKPEGFGAAVECGATFIRNEPFMLLLGDHIHIVKAGQPSCAAQVASVFSIKGGVAMVGMQVVSSEELSRVGVATGELISNGIYQCTGIVEKPDVNTAKERLVTKGLAKGQFLAHCGIYIFTAEIFECLKRLTKYSYSKHSEVELTDAQVTLLERHPNDYYLVQIDGSVYDTGSPSGYLSAQEVLSLQRGCI